MMDSESRGKLEEGKCRKSAAGNTTRAGICLEIAAGEAETFIPLPVN